MNKLLICDSTSMAYIFIYIILYRFGVQNAFEETKKHLQYYTYYNRAGYTSTNLKKQRARYIYVYVCVYKMNKKRR